MTKLKFIFAGLTAVLFLACSSSQVGLRESWVDERDIMALMGTPINEWLQNVGRPSLVEINGDTAICYFNYRPTLYKAVAYSGGKAEELKPTSASATEVWGSRKNLMQIKVVQNAVVSAVVVAGPDKRVYIRDLNGDFILDPKSGFTPDFSDEIKIKGNFDEFIKEYNSLNAKNPYPAEPVAPAAPAAYVPVVPVVPVAPPEPAATADPAAPADPAAQPESAAPAAAAPETPVAPEPAPAAQPAAPAAAPTAAPPAVVPVAPWETNQKK